MINADFGLLAWIKDGHRAAPRTNLNFGSIRPLHKRFTLKCRNTVSYNRIAVHLANLQTSLGSTTSRRLMRNLLFAALASRLPFVLHHVF